MTVTPILPVERCGYVYTRNTHLRSCKQPRFRSGNNEYPWCEYHIVSYRRSVPSHWAEQIDASFDPIRDLQDELQRSGAMVRWLEQIVADVHEEDLFRLHEREEDESDQFGNTVRRKVSDGVSPLIQQLMAERRHHTEVMKVALSLGLEQKQLEVNEKLALDLVAAMSELAKILGSDPSKPETRQAILTAMRTVRQAERPAALEPEAVT